MSLPMDLLKIGVVTIKLYRIGGVNHILEKLMVSNKTPPLKMVGENELIKSIPQANNKRQLEDESNDDEGHSKLKKQATLVQN